MARSTWGRVFPGSWRQAGLFFAALLVLSCALVLGVTPAHPGPGHAGAPGAPQAGQPAPPAQQPPGGAPAQQPPVGPAAPGDAVAPGSPGPARLALVVDDLGYSTPGTEDMLKLPRAVTLTFLPGSPRGAALAAEAAALGHEVLVHLPMVSSQPGVNAGPDALRPGMSAQEVAALVGRELDQYPQAVGVNNHMGSLAMADPALMDALMRVLASRGLFFLDSSTGPGSVAGAAAAAEGVSLATNDLFLDNVREPAAIQARLEEAVALAQRRGWAVAICHPSPAAAEVLGAALPGLEARGVEVVPVSALVEVTQGSLPAAGVGR